MNAKKWWAIPMLIVGAMGLAASLMASFSQGDQPALRLLITVVGDLATQPAVWVGIGGFFLWRSGSRQLAAESADSRTMMDPPVQAGAVTSSSEPGPEEPWSWEENPRSNTGKSVGLWVAAGVALAVAVGVGGYILGSNQGSGSAASADVQDETTTILSVSAEPVSATTTTTPVINEPTPASDLLFGRNADWRDGDGLYSDVLMNSSIGWEDLTLIVDGELSGLGVMGGACLSDACSQNLTYAIPDGNWDRHVWFVLDENSNASPALGLELTGDEDAFGACWSAVYELAVVYTYDDSTDGPEIRRVWAFGDGPDVQNWYFGDAADIGDHEYGVPEGILYDC
jgi:hypothetical protein